MIEEAQLLVCQVSTENVRAKGEIFTRKYEQSLDIPHSLLMVMALATSPEDFETSPQTDDSIMTQKHGVNSREIRSRRIEIGKLSQLLNIRLEPSAVS